MLCWWKVGRRKKESQTIDNLPVLATCLSDILAMLFNKVNGLTAHGSTQYCLMWLMDPFE